jgi:hypothetical protein
MHQERYRESLYKRARNTILRKALLSPQSLTIIGVALVCSAGGVGFLGASPVVWLLFGIIAELVYLTATLSDPAVGAIAVGEMFVQQYNLAEIQNYHSRQRLQQALEYYDGIHRIALQHGGATRVQIEATLSEINDWLGQIYKLARRIDSYEASELIRRDRSRVPNELNALRLRLDKETDERVKVELGEAVRLKETQLANLQALETNVRRADIQLDNTLAALGTIFAQIQVVDSKDVDGRRAHRLRQEIQDEVLSLKDTIEAIDDVQSTGSNLYALS